MEVLVDMVVVVGDMDILMGKTEDQVRSIAEKTLGFTDGENGTGKNTVIKNVWRTVSAVALRFPAAK